MEFARLVFAIVPSRMIVLVEQRIWMLQPDRSFDYGYVWQDGRDFVQTLSSRKDMQLITALEHLAPDVFHVINVCCARVRRALKRLPPMISATRTTTIYWSGSQGSLETNYGVFEAKGSDSAK